MHRPALRQRRFAATVWFNPEKNVMTVTPTTTTAATVAAFVLAAATLWSKRAKPVTMEISTMPIAAREFAKWLAAEMALVGSTVAPVKQIMRLATMATTTTKIAVRQPVKYQPAAMAF
jgi:hypothetical protein